MIIGRNQRKSNQHAFYVDKEQIKITHEYKYLGSSSIHMVGLSHQVKGTYRMAKEIVVGATCWKSKSHLLTLW